MSSVIGSLFLAYARQRRRRIARWMRDPMAEQERLLRRLVRRAADTRFGRDHDFHAIATARDYQERVPLHRFEELQPYWDRLDAGERDVVWPGRIRNIAATSGSTGVPKNVPVSRAGLRAYLRAGRDILVHYVANTRDVDHFRGRFLYLGGSRQPRPGHPGGSVGDLSGLAAEHMPRLYRPYRLPTPGAHLIPDWEAKLDAVADEAWNADVRGISGIPSWLLALFERVLDRRRARGLPAATLADAWPNLSLVVHGGVNFEPYRTMFADLVGKPVCTLEVYIASEGFLALQDRPDSRDLLLLMDAGVFHEFVPVEELGAGRPRRLTAADVETGVEYAIAVTTVSGLYSSLIGDTVRFVSLRPHRIRFAGRTEQFLSAFGEHLRAADVEAAMVAACAATGATAREFHVAPVYPTRDSLRRGHQWFVEFARAPEEPGTFLETLDRTLQNRNVDYQEQRLRDAGVPLPEIIPVPPGTFGTILAEQAREAGRGAQRKLPRLQNDRELAERIVALLRGRDRP